MQLLYVYARLIATLVFGNVLKGIKKRGPDRENSPKYLSFGEKIVKIGPVDRKMICLKLKKEINASKIYSPVGNLAERAKNTQRKHTYKNSPNTRKNYTCVQPFVLETAINHVLNDAIVFPVAL